MPVINPDKTYRLIIVADSNDADYVTQITKISGADIIEWIVPVIEKIKLCTAQHNWYDMWDGNREKHPQDMYDLTDEQNEWMMELVPSIEGGVHSIKSIRITEWVDEVELF